MTPTTSVQPKTAHDLSDVTALILAGGLGTRLRTVVSDRSKTVATVAGRPFIAYLLDQLIAVGVRHVVLCTGYLGASVRRRFGERYGPARIEYSHEPAPLGTAGALRLALPLCRSDVALIMNGDTYCEADLREMWRAHRLSGADGTILLSETLDTRRYGRVEVDDEGYVAAFEEKIPHARRGWVNAGVYLLSTKLLMAIRPFTESSLERDMLPAWAARGLRAHRTRGRFLDIGTPESYERAEQFFRKVQIR